MIIYGKNPVRSAIGAGHVKVLYVSGHLLRDSLVSLAKSSSVPIREVSDHQLDEMTSLGVHQGFAALVSSYTSWTLDDLLSQAKKPYPLILLLDGVEDPHNLGAILRSADAFGADGVILKTHDGVQLNGTVAKVSTGAIDYVKVVAVSNLSRAMETLKERGYWIVASDGSATESYTAVDYASPIGLLIGSEGYGISPLLLKRSDFVVKIPMFGHVNSLNASVATGILLSEIVRSRQTR